MKEHLVREMVNELRDTANIYCGTAQLRDRISLIVHKYLCDEDLDKRKVIGEIKVEELGRLFNSAQAYVHFYEDVPPVGTKLYVTTTEPLRQSDKKEPQPGLANLDVFKAIAFDDYPYGVYIGSTDMVKWLIRNRSNDYWSSKATSRDICDND